MPGLHCPVEQIRLPTLGIHEHDYLQIFTASSQTHIIIDRCTFNLRCNGNAVNLLLITKLSFEHWHLFT